MAPVCSRSSRRIASTSRVGSISLLATTPPPGSSSCQETPKSWRLILAVASKPIRRISPLFSSPSHQGRLPLAEVGDVDRDRAGHAANRQVDLALERAVGGALGEAAAEADLGVVLDVEEGGAAQVGVAGRLAGPDAGRVDLALEGRVEAAVPVELEPSV